MARCNVPDLDCRYLSTEVAGGMTGQLVRMYVAVALVAATPANLTTSNRLVAALMRVARVAPVPKARSLEHGDRRCAGPVPRGEATS